MCCYSMLGAFVSHVRFRGLFCLFVVVVVVFGMLLCCQCTCLLIVNTVIQKRPAEECVFMHILLCAQDMSDCPLCVIAIL